MSSHAYYDPSCQRPYDYDYTTSRPHHESRPTSYKSEHRTYDPRYSHPPPPTRVPSHAHVPARIRRRWPPQPSVEEERDSLVKELSYRAVEQHEAYSRGTIDQDPIMVEVDLPILAGNTETSYVWIPTPPTSDDEVSLRGRKKTSKTATTGLPEMARSSSKYAFTPTLNDNNFRAPTRYVASPDSLTPPSTANPPAPRQPPPTSAPSRSGFKKAGSPSPPPSQAGRRSQNQDAFLSGDVIDDSDLGVEDSATLRSRRKTGRVSFSDQEAPALGRGPATTNSYGMPRPNLPSRPHLSEDSRRYTDSTTEMPRQLQKPAPLKVATLVHEASSASPNTPQSRSSSSRISSRESTHSWPATPSQFPPSPPRSPRASLDRSRENTHHSASTSLHASKESSKTPSPQHSPQLNGTIPTSDSAWRSVFARNAARTTHPTTRLASSVLQEDIPHVSINESSTSRQSSGLPYPVDDIMPEERDHQYFPEPTSFLAPAPMTASTIFRSTTPVSIPLPKQRPSLVKHHTVAESLPSSPAAMNVRHTSFTNSMKQSQPQSTRDSNTSSTLPKCSRMEYSNRYNDWYTLEDSPNFDICPDCFKKVFSRTEFRSAFKRASPRSSSAMVKCDFGDPWYRLAWLLTVKRGYVTLGLLKSLAHHMHTEDRPCPGPKESTRLWYTIYDKETGRYVKKLTICPSDIRKLEILLPNLKGTFVPLPARTSTHSHHSSASPIIETTSLCALRPTANNRFATYLDRLIDAHEPAFLSNRTPNLTSAITYIKHKLSLEECTRDHMLYRSKWYFAPSIPCFTVCEDCHDDVIEPSLRGNNDIAMRFNHHMQRAPLEHHTLGSSCQLYSPYMRKVWERAVREGDIKYLARKAGERKETEERLQSAHVEIERRRAKLSGVEGERAEREWERLTRDLVDLSLEWAECE